MNQIASSMAPQAPGVDKLAWELPLAAKEFISLMDYRWRALLKKAPKGDGHPVMTIPGFGGGDGCMSILRKYLTHWGYDARPWDLGTNLITEKVHTLDEVLEFCADKESAIAANLERIVEETGEKVTLIGWSMGGIYANCLAQTRPDLVRHVITLGSPVGDPRGTSVWNIMKTVFGGDVPDELQNVDAWVDRRDQLAERKVRTTMLFSPSDGAVSKDCATLQGHDMVENIMVPSSHVGFSHNPVVYWIIAERLCQNPERWHAFEPHNMPFKVRKQMSKVSF